MSLDVHIRTAARALRRHNTRMVQAHGTKPPKLAIVTSVNPLAADMIDHRIQLDEEDLLMTQVVRRYELDYGIREGDTLVLLQLSSDDFAVVGVVSDTDVDPFIVDEGNALPVRPTVNFVGTGVKATDDADNGRTNVRIYGGKGVILNGQGPPADDVGEEGNYYLDTDTDTLYGPKQDTAPYWPVAIAPTPLPARLGASGPTITNFNSPTESGWYRPNNASNGPSGATPYGMLFHNAWDQGNGHAMQLFMPMYDAQGTLWMRLCNTYVWQAWKKVAPIDDTNLPNRLKTSTVVEQFNDANLGTESGFRQILPGAANSPDSAMHWHMVISAHDTNYLVQIAYALYDTRVFQRKRSSGAWGAWTKIAPLAYADFGEIGNANLPGRLETGGPYVGNLDTEDAGWCSWSPGTTGNPNSSYGTCLTIKSGDWYGRQIAFDISGQHEWQRNRTGAGNTWSAWWQTWPIQATAVPVNDTNLPGRLQGVSALYVSDWNSARENGWYRSLDGANNPRGGWLVGMVTSHDANYVQQRVWAMTDSSGYEAMRLCIGGSWTGWWQIGPPGAEQTLPLRLRAGEVVNFTANADNANQSGWWHTSSASTGTPYASDWYISVISYDGSSGTGAYIKQVAYNFYNTDIYQRVKVAGLAFQAWTKMWPIPLAALPALPASSIPTLTQPQCPVGDTNLPTRLRTQTTAIGAEVGDWNNARENGWYQGPPGTPNAPDGNWYQGMVVSHRATGPGTSAYITQEIWCFTGGTFSEPRWRRACRNDSWTGWQRIADQWIQTGHYVYAPFVDLQAVFYFPEAFPGYPTVTFSPWNDGRTEKLMIMTIQPSYFSIGGVNYYEGGITVDWTAVYK